MAPLQYVIDDLRRAIERIDSSVDLEETSNALESIDSELGLHRDQLVRIADAGERIADALEKLVAKGA